MKKALLALVAISIAAVFGYTLGRRGPEHVIGTAWAQRFVRDPSAIGIVMLDGEKLEGIIGVEGLEESCEIQDPGVGEGQGAGVNPITTRYSNLTLSYVMDPGKPNLLYNWYKSSVIGDQPRLEKKAGSIIIISKKTEEEVMRFNFFEGWPCKWYVPELDSDSSGMAIEKIEIAVEKVERS